MFIKSSEAFTLIKEFDNEFEYAVNTAINQIVEDKSDICHAIKYDEGPIIIRAENNIWLSANIDYLMFETINVFAFADVVHHYASKKDKYYVSARTFNELGKDIFHLFLRKI